MIETWLNERLPTQMKLQSPALFGSRRDRSSGRKGGGVAIYISKKIPAVRRCDLEDTALENLWLESTLPKSKRMILSFWKSLNWAWKECRERIKTTLLTGDFN